MDFGVFTASPPMFSCVILKVIGTIVRDPAVAHQTLQQEALFALRVFYPAEPWLGRFRDLTPHAATNPNPFVTFPTVLLCSLMVLVVVAVATQAKDSSGSFLLPLR